jgi:hypothetical protein
MRDLLISATCPPPNGLRFSAISTRDFGTFGMKVSTSYPPICQNGEISTRRLHGSHTKHKTSCLFQSFRPHDFVSPDVELPTLQLMKPRNGQKSLTSVLASTPPVHSQMDGCDYLMTSPLAKSKVLPFGPPMSESPIRVISRHVSFRSDDSDSFAILRPFTSIDTRLSVLQLTKP